MVGAILGDGCSHLGLKSRHMVNSCGKQRVRRSTVKDKTLDNIFVAQRLLRDRTKVVQGMLKGWLDKGRDENSWRLDEEIL